MSWERQGKVLMYGKCNIVVTYTINIKIDVKTGNAYLGWGIANREKMEAGLRSRFASSRVKALLSPTHPHHRTPPPPSSSPLLCQWPKMTQRCPFCLQVIIPLLLYFFLISWISMSSCTSMSVTGQTKANDLFRLCDTVCCRTNP